MESHKLWEPIKLLDIYIKMKRLRSGDVDDE